MADWSEIEVELIVADYFQMLHEEICGKKVNKTTHRNALIPLLNNRNDGSVEYKHRNISAALINLGLPYINGYKPMWHYQKLIDEKIYQYLSVNRAAEKDFNAFAYQKLEILKPKIEFSHWLEAPPERTFVSEPTVEYYKPIKRNYLEIEQKNRSIGETGEQLVFDYEKWRLNNAGQPKLAREVKWISRDDGDGAGFDILSKNLHGEDIFIEVKSTTLGKDTPIFFSKTENDFSNEKKEAFHLYRVFELKKQPKMFMNNGSFQNMCSMEAINFKGFF